MFEKKTKNNNRQCMKYFPLSDIFKYEQFVRSNVYIFRRIVEELCHNCAVIFDRNR